MRYLCPYKFLECKAFSAIGLFFVVTIAIKLLKFIYVTFLRSPVNWEKYGLRSGGWVIVTGATDGIGKEFAKQFASKGFNIFLVSRSQTKLDDISKEIRNINQSISKAKTETREFSRLKAAISEVKSYILINNVGVANDLPRLFNEEKEEMIEKLIQINVTGTLEMTKAILPIFVAQKNGFILTVGSFAGEFPMPYLQTYGAAKAFLKMWSLSLNREVSKDGIHVELLNTSFVSTKMSKLKPSFMAPSAKEYVEHAMKKIGISSFTTPYWPHAIAYLVSISVPSCLRTMKRVMKMAAKEK
ncbi:NAD(P)-binding domain-containing protein [Rozella allomycis CSF55]|uniref:NAD(P)-binding domain-containing protein n=1 Tax=Rozella allomycis (strain CSF55) TaxID=988480 RepID=A0A075B0Y9_ROZAC|nr:NAD(P)-binding domain-containing protein [Rozella allomycis CSF55]|eukprot:EPZ36234.1 NAD(P)-binding domain-containing protein [Rozella allomycis CSF55]